MLYQVDKNGKAPANAKTGDYIVTGAGSYEVLDPTQYSDMDASQLAKAGVSYNPNSGLYSKKVKDKNSQYYTGKTGSYDAVGNNTASRLNSILGSDGYTFRNYDNSRKASDAYREQMEAEIEGNYDEDLATVKKNYNTNLANQEKQINQANSAYDKNMSNLMDDAYAAQVSATQIAANRGMTSSAQGLAMNVAADMQVAKRKSELTGDRDTLINDINTEMNRIEENYGIDRATLKKKFNADKLTALSTSELQYMQACLEIDDYNANTWNNAVANKQTQDYQSAEAKKERAFQAAEAAKDRALQRAFSGGGGGSGSTSDEDETVNPTVAKYARYLNLRLQQGKIDENQYNELATSLEMYAAGDISYDDYAKKYYKYVWNKDYGKSGDTGKNEPKPKSTVQAYLQMQKKREANSTLGKLF